MNHNMNLTEKYFRLLESGIKDIEVRLLDKKRSILKEGDTITFTNQNKEIVTKIIKISTFNSVIDLVDSVPLSRIGLSNLKSIATKEILDIYPKEKLNDHKILAIEIKKIST
ncbi:ASCH domain-containing protein [Clostridium paraputrificum]|uniref:ASCH domain-containing protein n=1 Tax=Clostridium paraputrificum TaxID=29363 RepID=UPI000DD0DCF1|nr:ASCH domain-containing protein [Clostridium paraputrificum]